MQEEYEDFIYGNRQTELPSVTKCSDEMPPLQQGNDTEEFQRERTVRYGRTG